MPIDLNSHKVATFPGINDSPVEPTAAKAGNGAHLISLHNNLVDDVQNNLNSLTPLSTTDELAEGATNFYFTSERVDDRVNDLIVDGIGITKYYNEALNKLTLDSSPFEIAKGITQPVNITSGLLSFWKFEEDSGIRNDSIGNNHFTPTGIGINKVIGKVGAAVEISDSSYLRTTGNNPALNLTDTTDYTLSIWIRPAVVTPQIIFIHDVYFYLFINSQSKLAWLITDAPGSTRVVICNEFVVNANQWYYVETTYNTTLNQISIQVNRGTVYTSPCNSTIQSGASSFTIGAYNGNSDFYSGSVDSLGLWNRLLTDSEKDYLFNAGDGREIPAIIDPNQIDFVSPPLTANSQGRKGEMRFDATYLYICTELNSWKRCLLSSW